MVKKAVDGSFLNKREVVTESEVFSKSAKFVFAGASLSLSLAACSQNGIEPASTGAVKAVVGASSAEAIKTPLAEVPIENPLKVKAGIRSRPILLRDSRGETNGSRHRR